jgi:hypothetical protein
MFLVALLSLRQSRQSGHSFPLLTDSVEKLERRNGWTRVSRWCPQGEWRGWGGVLNSPPQASAREFSLASLLRTVAARRHWSRAPFGPRSLSRSRRRMRLRCANRISTFLRCRRKARPSSLYPMWRAMSRAPSKRERGTFCAGAWGAAAGFAGAGVARELARAVEEGRAVVHQCAPRGQHLARWADIDIALAIVGEVLVRTCRPGARIGRTP